MFFVSARAESSITQMVMKHKGVFKTDMRARRAGG
jgi:hypothetical protein